MASKKKKKRPGYVPQRLGDAAESLLQIGTLQRELRGIKDELEETIAGLKKNAMARAEPLTQELQARVAGIWVYAKANEGDITDHGKRRSVQVPTGSFGWRTHPPAVRISNGEKVITELKALGLDQFIRTVEEPDKQAMLKEPELAGSVKGVKIAQDETFFVKPSVTDVEVEEPLKNLEAEWE